MSTQRERDPSLVLAILALACVTLALMQTAVVPVLAYLQRDLHTTSTWATWTVTGFLLSMAVATPVVGRLGDLYGRRRVFMLSLGVFVVAAIGAAAAWNIWSLILFRVLQGSAGALYPLAYAIIRDTFPPDRVRNGVALLAGTSAIGASSGWVVSGLLVDQISWRWLFAPSIVSAASGLVLVWRFVPESTAQRPARPDIAGAIVFATALAVILFGLSEAEHWGWASPRVLLLWMLGALMLVGWVRLERRVLEPMIDLGILVEPAPVIAIAFACGLATYAPVVFLPLLIETNPSSAPYGLGYTATQTGLVLVGGAIMMFLASLVIGRLAPGVRMERVVSVGGALMCAGTLSLAFFHAGWWQVSIPMVVWGLGVGLAWNSLPALLSTFSDQSDTAVLNGINLVARCVGMILVTQLGAALLASLTLAQNGAPSEAAFVAIFLVGAASAAAVTAMALFWVQGRRRAQSQDLALAGSTL